MRSLHPWPIFPPNLEPPAARSLSLLFILQELLSSFDLIQKLYQITPQQLQGASLAEQISNELEKFLLFSLENPFAQKGGTLDKLCFYCGILLQASKVNQDKLPMVLEEARTIVLRLKKKLHASKKASSPLPQILGSLFDTYAELKEKFRNLFSALIVYLLEARSDENVLLSLVEKRERLNQSLGPRFIEEMLRGFFPMGVAQLRAAICEGYTRRGFAAFFTEQEPLIDQLEWETACLSPLQMR